MAPRVPAALCGAALILSLTACGAAGTAAPTAAPSGEVVATVGTYSITKTALAHWARALAVLTHEFHPNQPTPRGLVPEPPDYEGCIAYLAKSIAQQGGHESSSRVLKTECAQERKNLEQQALSMLVTRFWVSQEAKRHGIRITAHEIQAEMARKFSQQALRSFEPTGVRPSDARFFVENQVLLTKLQRSTLPAYAKLRRSRHPETLSQVNEIDGELQKLSDEMSKRWTPRTHCQVGYVVAVCKTPS